MVPVIPEEFGDPSITSQRRKSPLMAENIVSINAFSCSLSIPGKDKTLIISVRKGKG